MAIPSKLRDSEINFVLLERGGKKPFQKEWQKKKIKWNDSELEQHLINKGNYGIMGGGEKKLLLLDFDSEKIQEQVLPKLPKTFTVKTGSGLLHKYFFSDATDPFKIFDGEMNTLADVQGEGKQVVGPGSIHPNGNPYEIVDNEDIAFISYSELKAILMVYDNKPKRKKAQEKVYEGIGNDFVDEIKSRVSFESLLSEFGVDTSTSPTNCPFHASKGGKCLGWTDEVAHCFHCDDSWNMFSWVMSNKDMDFKEALEWLAEREGMSDQLKTSRKEWKKAQRAEKLGVIQDKEAQAKLFAEAQPYFYDKNRIWWLWDEEEFRWELVDEVDILNMISESCNRDVITSKARAETLNALKQEGRKSIPKPIKRTWIQFKNKIIDIENGEEREATPEYFVTNPIPWKIAEFPDTPVMDRIFTEWVGQENVELLYEILSYCLLPDMPIHRIFCFIGAGMNGKSKFLLLLRKFVGMNNCCSTELDTLLSSRFEVTRLHKKLVCQMGETDFNEMNKTSILKKLSGGDLIGFEYKNKNPFEEYNYAKIIIATNNLPSTTDKTIGFYRRWAIIDFPNEFSEKKDILSEIPKQEYESLALRTIVTLKSLLKKRTFTNEGSIEERIQRYEDRSNPLEKFMKEHTEEIYNSHIWKWEFLDRLKQFCKENGLRDISDMAVGRKMKQLGIQQELKTAGDFSQGKRWRAWINLGWKDKS